MCFSPRQLIGKLVGAGVGGRESFIVSSNSGKRGIGFEV